MNFSFVLLKIVTLPHEIAVRPHEIQGDISVTLLVTLFSICNLDEDQDKSTSKILFKIWWKKSTPTPIWRSKSIQSEYTAQFMR